MRQWVVHAWDGEDDEAQERRQATRPSHLDGVRELKRRGQFVIGGAMLDHEGRMIGSTMIVQFETEAELQDWLGREPYLTQGVWVRCEIHPFRVAEIQ